MSELIEKKCDSDLSYIFFKVYQGVALKLILDFSDFKPKVQFVIDKNLNFFIVFCTFEFKYLGNPAILK